MSVSHQRTFSDVMTYLHYVQVSTHSRCYQNPVS